MEGEPSRRRRVASVAVALLLVGGFLLAVGPRRVLAELGAGDPRWLAAAALATVGSLVCWAAAQRALFAAAGARIPPVRFFRAYLAGNLVKLSLPGGRVGGPAIMAYALGRQTDLAYERDLATTTVGKLIGFPASVVPASAALLVVATPAVTDRVVVLVPALAGVAGVVVGAGAVVAAGLGGAGRLAHGAAGLGRATAGRLSARVRDALATDRVDRALVGVGETLRAMGRDRRALAVAFGLTVAGWVAAALALSAALVALDYPPAVALALLAVPLASLGNAVPLPAGLGGVDVALGGLLVALVGLELAAAAAVVLTYRLASDGLVVLLGGLVAVSRALRGERVV
jgi:uncharacterized protein (TIRG00374 family)